MLGVAAAGIEVDVAWTEAGTRGAGDLAVDAGLFDGWRPRAWSRPQPMAPQAMAQLSLTGRTRLLAFGASAKSICLAMGHDPTGTASAHNDRLLLRRTHHPARSIETVVSRV
jgi:hypothetical protein